MIDLVTWKAERTLQEFDDLLSTPFVWDSALAVDSADVSLVCGEIVLNTISNSADFYRRIIRVVRAWPHLLLWLVKKPADVCCEELARRGDGVGVDTLGPAPRLSLFGPGPADVDIASRTGLDATHMRWASSPVWAKR